MTCVRALQVPDLMQLPYAHPHLLRHSCATLLSECGYSDAVIGGILGHATGSSITRRYVHSTDRAKRAAVEALEVLIFGPAEAVREAI